MQEQTETGATEENVNGLEAPAVAAAEEKTEKLTKFPLGRVKHIMKMDPDLTMASQESVFLVTKALEMFVESLARSSHWLNLILSSGLPQAPKKAIRGHPFSNYANFLPPPFTLIEHDSPLPLCVIAKWMLP